ncbi:2,3,4,5-tetrahydropyridine-2,6-dicarboxylate N-succinyltransferase [Congregibacter variabilis]|uniref:2,3,4,5-tetrahydropyridine-2,6-dicarboxylate N-succinyltransferase n=1 Tax=Congregibacter variabilis TaxID=3081200 RepID=A0ABZ0I350_9GAMM|nr:2,3,4,5-tetrahydropyridine-2,6-dicarboxylate N-succinyltransferase [Congregibacter sp. IMCC43200]
MNAYALGLGLGTRDQAGNWLEVFFPMPILNPQSSLVACLGEHASDLILSADDLLAIAGECDAAGHEDTATLARKMADSNQPAVAVCLQDDSAPKTVPAAYLKLQLLSHRLVLPQETVLEGVFGVLPNVAWTDQGAIALSELAERQLDARLRGEVLEVSCVDKFPKMTNYVVPGGVRIAHTARVRLGAYVGEGTTVMHEGFINFNAGTIGPGMIEGRVSAGVLVGADSDLGGGSSTMGTLSGGGNIIISVGKQCLIGANAGIGIPLGDRCIVESGLYVTSGTKVTMLDASGTATETLAARKLQGMSDLLFRRNSLNGAVECLTNKTSVQLNAALHAND